MQQKTRTPPRLITSPAHLSAAARSRSKRLEPPSAQLQHSVPQPSVPQPSVTQHSTAAMGPDPLNVRGVRFAGVRVARVPAPSHESDESLSPQLPAMNPMHPSRCSSYEDKASEELSFSGQLVELQHAKSLNISRKTSSARSFSVSRSFGGSLRSLRLAALATARRSAPPRA